MSVVTWREYILERFPGDGPRPRLVLQEDTDCLLADEAIFRELGERGWRVMPFTTTLALRDLYENWLLPSNDTCLVVIFREGEDVEAVVPSDIQKWEWTYCAPTLSMHEIFPNLSCAVLRELDRRYITELFLHRSEAVTRGGDVEDTCEFVLEDILGISATSVRNMPELLDRLYEVHVRHAINSPRLLGYFRDSIRNKVKFSGLRRDGGILTDAVAFRTWVSAAWRREVRAGLPDADFAEMIDFKDRRVREVLCRLFRHGWIALEGDMSEMAAQLDYLFPRERGSGALGEHVLPLPIQELEERIPSGDDANWADWIRFAREWAEFTHLVDARKIDVSSRDEVHGRIDAVFYEWMVKNYEALASIPAQIPVTVSQIVKVMAKVKDAENIKKIALVVVDGMAWNQWVPVRRSIENDFRLTEHGTFACVPTLTSVSRQAIFAGKQPCAFASSIGTTGREPKLWREAWQSLGTDPARVKHVKHLGLGDPRKDVLDWAYTGVDALGLVVDTIDGFAHGTMMGNQEMHDRIAQWLEAEYLAKLLKGLVDDIGYTVFITSDHGNVECTGSGALNEGILANMKGERTRIYSNDVLRGNALAKYPKAKPWIGSDLPEDFKPIVLTGMDAFVSEGEKLVAHGGVSLDEVVVPFVRVERKTSL